MDFRQIKRAIANAFADDRYRELRLRIHGLEKELWELKYREIREIVQEYVETELEKRLGKEESDEEYN